MENEILVYWKGKPVGMETAGRITWFVSAPAEAIKAYAR